MDDHQAHRFRQGQRRHVQTVADDDIQQRADVFAPRCQRAGAREHQHGAMRLHCPGHMDRLIGTVVQIDWKTCHWQLNQRRKVSGYRAGSTTLAGRRAEDFHWKPWCRSIE
jgi:hypothetical protein